MPIVCRSKITSNHNRKLFVYNAAYVVCRSKITSNHNTLVTVSNTLVLYVVPKLHQTTT